MSVDPLRSGLIFSFRPLDSSTINPSSSIPVRNLNLQTPGFSKDGLGSIPQSTNHPSNGEKAAESSVKDIFEKLYRATPLPAILTGKTPTSNNVRINQTHHVQVSVPQSQSHYLNSVTKRIDYGEVVRESPQQPYLTPAVMLPPPLPSRPPQSAPVSLQSTTSTPVVAVRPTVTEQPIPAPPTRATTSECSVQTMPTIPEESEESPPVSPVKKPSSKIVQAPSLPPSSPQAPKTTTNPTPVSLPVQSNIVVASPPPVESIRPSTDLVTNIYQQVMAKLAQDVAQHLISPRIVSTLVEQQLSSKIPKTDLLAQLDEQVDPIESTLPFDEQTMDPEPEEPKQAPAPSPVRKKPTSKPPLPPTSSSSATVTTDRRTRATQQKTSSSLLIAADPLPAPTKSSDSITSQSEEESNLKVVKKKKVLPKTIVSNSLLGIAAEEREKPEPASSSSSQLGKRSREMPANSLIGIASSSIKSEDDSENTENNFVEEKKQVMENPRKRRMEFSSALLSTLIEPVKSSPVKTKPQAVFVTSSLTEVDSPLPVRAKKTEKADSPVPTSSSSSEEDEEEETVKRSTRRQRSPVHKEAAKKEKEINNSLPQRSSSRSIKKAIVSSETSSSSSEKEIHEKVSEEEIVQYSSPQRGHQQKENKKSTKQPKKKDDVNASPTKVKGIKQRANEFVQMKESLLLLSQQTASPSPKKASAGSVSSSLLQTTDAGPWRQHELIALYAAHGKTDVRKANFWEIISQKLREGGINRSKEECEQQWFRHLQQTEERKANNLKKKKESQTTKAMEKFDSLLQQNTNNSKSRNNAAGKKRKSSKKAKEDEEEEEEQEEMEVAKEEEEDQEDEQDKQTKKKPRILKKDLELIAQQSALATKHDDIFESEKFKKQLQTGHRTSFTSNLLHNISTSISSPKMSSPVAITRTRGRRYSEKNVSKGRKGDKDEEDDEEDEDKEEEEEEEDNSEKEEVKSKSKTIKGRGSSVITSTSTRHVRGYGAEVEEESLFKKQHIQKINKTRIKPQLLVSYAATENNSSQSNNNNGKNAHQKGGKGGSVEVRGGGVGFGGSSSLLSSLYPQDKLTNRLEQRDYVKQQNDEFNQKLKKSFQQMNKLKKREEDEEDSEEESIGEEDSSDLESEED